MKQEMNYVDKMNKNSLLYMMTNYMAHKGGRCKHDAKNVLAAINFLDWIKGDPLKTHARRGTPLWIFSIRKSLDFLGTKEYIYVKEMVQQLFSYLNPQKKIIFTSVFRKGYIEKIENRFERSMLLFYGFNPAMKDDKASMLRIRDEYRFDPKKHEMSIVFVSSLKQYFKRGLDRLQQSKILSRCIFSYSDSSLFDDSFGELFLEEEEIEKTINIYGKKIEKIQIMRMGELYYRRTSEIKDVIYKENIVFHSVKRMKKIHDAIIRKFGKNNKRFSEQMYTLGIYVESSKIIDDEYYNNLKKNDYILEVSKESIDFAIDFVYHETIEAYKVLFEHKGFFLY